MKTISIHFSQNNNGVNQSITTKTLYKNFKYYQNYNPAAGDVNRNATISQIEHERNVCEEELYRLRYGIENLLANKEQGDFKMREHKDFKNIENPFRTMITNICNLNNKKITSWINRCTPCCRRWRRDNRRNNSIFKSNEYSHRQIYNDQNYDNPSHRTPKSSQLYSDSFISSSPSISSRYINPNRSRKKHNLKRSISKLMNGMTTSSKMNGSNLLKSKDINDSLYNSLILKILEAKALDCLCTGYSKENTQKQISNALNEMNQRIGEQQLDSTSATSSPSSNKSSILTDDKFPSSQFNTPQLSNEEISSPSSSDNEPPSVNETTSTLSSPDNNKQKIKSSLKLNENIKSPKKKSKVTIVGDKTPQLNKLTKKKRSSSKHRKKYKKGSKQKRKPTSVTMKRTKSRTSNKKRGKSQTSNRKRSSSKLKKQKGSSKSSSRSKYNKNRQTKNNRRTKKKRTKPKSNNQMNDHETVMLPIFIYPQSYQEVYQHRQRLLKLLLSST
ncbi:unnamed protein product [Rotaria sp. Silwood2]|nr:unnamed protein product [Rotaria sp. Silwood2]CAF3925628.1 unnamed protein product [Rotaria sp. Silwood2]CAF3971915.1 unnamed protein product [Rotaria sp. Silwood2]CAF4090386.1 unnamed protein product [Rotaria sp. Silwood2]